MASIDIIDTNGNTYRYPLPEDGSILLIGSGSECSISLPQLADLLPQHCTISLQAEGYVIAQATPEATLLAEGQPTQAAVLVPGVTYHLGSTSLLYMEAEPAEATGAEETGEEEIEAETEAEASTPKKKKKKKAPRPGNLLSVSSYTEEDSALHIVVRRLYVILILALAFLAGLTMRYWMITGEYLIDELLK